MSDLIPFPMNDNERLLRSIFKKEYPTYIALSNEEKLDILNKMQSKIDNGETTHLTELYDAMLEILDKD